MKDSAEAVTMLEIFLGKSRIDDRQKVTDLINQITELQNTLDFFTRKQKLQNQIVALIFVKKRKHEELIKRFSDWASAEEVNTIINEFVQYGVLEPSIDWQLGFSKAFASYPKNPYPGIHCRAK